MLNTLPRLSLWEIACRTNNFDPRSTQIEDMPLSVRDALKSLSRAIHYDDIHLLNSKGIENHHAYNAKINTKYSIEIIHEKISECYEEEKFDRDFLDTVFIENEDFAKWCAAKNIPSPNFWFPNGWNQEEKIVIESTKPEVNLRPSQVDKLVCQGISRTLWDIFPNMTIASMCKHESIQKYGNGKLYTGMHTLRDWISEVAPESIKGNRGRPKNAKPSNYAL